MTAYSSMLTVGRDRLLNECMILPVSLADAEKLPFPDNYFNLVSVAFGLRNMTHKDVGSTKQSALNAFRTHLSDRLPQCFAAHPIAGSDQSGAKSARCGLFQNSRLIITPHGQEASDGLRRLKSLWQAVGSQISTMSAEEHDNI